MANYSSKAFDNKFGVFKKLLPGDSGSNRFGGFNAQLAYKLSDGSPVPVTLHHSGVNVVVVDEDTVSVGLMAINKDVPSTFTDPTIVDVTGSYSVPGDKYAVVLDGAVDLNGTQLDGNTGLHKLDPGATVTGNAKLVVFGFEQS